MTQVPAVVPCLDELAVQAVCGYPVSVFPENREINREISKAHSDVGAGGILLYQSTVFRIAAPPLHRPNSCLLERSRHCFSQLERERDLRTFSAFVNQNHILSLTAGSFVCINPLWRDARPRIRCLVKNVMDNLFGIPVSAWSTPHRDFPETRFQGGRDDDLSKAGASGTFNR